MGCYVSARLGFLSAQGVLSVWGLLSALGLLSAQGLCQSVIPELPKSQDSIIGLVKNSNLSKKIECVKCIRDRELCFTYIDLHFFTWVSALGSSNSEGASRISK